MLTKFVCLLLVLVGVSQSFIQTRPVVVKLDVLLWMSESNTAQTLNSISGHCLFSGRIFRNNCRELIR